MPERLSGEMPVADELRASFIAVGSNIDPEPNILKALTLLAEHVHVTALSTFYSTPALGRPEQPDFINGVCLAMTGLSAAALKLDVLRPIEAALGRARSADRYAPRAIDLDILLLGDIVVREPGLQIPDPDVRTRRFLAVPLLELAPDLILPDTEEAISAVVDGMPDETRMIPMYDYTQWLRARVMG